jgi:hypothetical protein
VGVVALNTGSRLGRPWRRCAKLLIPPPVCLFLMMPTRLHGKGINSTSLTTTMKCTVPLSFHHHRQYNQSCRFDDCRRYSTQGEKRKTCERDQKPMYPPMEQQAGSSEYATVSFMVYSSHSSSLSIAHVAFLCWCGFAVNALVLLHVLFILLTLMGLAARGEYGLLENMMLRLLRSWSNHRLFDCTASST